MSHIETPTVERFSMERRGEARYQSHDPGTVVGHTWFEMRRVPHGEWVRHADYLTLQAECDHERHEKETVAEAAQAYKRWAEAECERLKKDNSAAVETLERALEATDYAAPRSDTDTLRKAIREALAHLRQRGGEKP